MPPPPLRAAAALGISCRLQSAEDLAFVELLYRSTRAAEFELFGWPDELEQKFITQQQFAQSKHIEQHYPAAERLLVERDGAPVGRLYVEDRPHEIWLVDITLMPECRGRGIGTALLGDLLEQGRRAGKPVALNVVKASPARRLYARLGFIPVLDRGESEWMEWRPDPGGEAPPAAGPEARG